LINDVLDLSKIEAGQLMLSLADYSLREVLHGVFTGVETLASENGALLQARSSPPDLPRRSRRRATDRASVAQPDLAMPSSSPMPAK